MTLLINFIFSDFVRKFRHFFPILWLLYLASCAPRKIHTASSTTYRDSTIITEKLRYIDTTLHIDSSVSIVRIECDSQNKPQIISSNQTHGKTKIVLTNNGNSTFKIKCEADSLHLLIAVKDSIIRSYRSEKTETTTVIEQKKGFWQSMGEFARHLVYIIIIKVIAVVAFILLRRR